MKYEIKLHTDNGLVTLQDETKIDIVVNTHDLLKQYPDYELVACSLFEFNVVTLYLRKLAGWAEQAAKKRESEKVQYDLRRKGFVKLAQQIKEAL